MGGEPVKVLTLNIWNIIIAQENAARMAALKDILRRAAAGEGGAWDVVLLQELWPRRDRTTFDDVGYASAVDRERYFDRPVNYLAAFLSLFGFRYVIDSGLKILTRYPVLEVKRRSYTPGGKLKNVFKDGEILARKAALAAKLDHPDWGPVWVVDTHLIATHCHEYYVAARLRQLEELAEFIRTELTGAPVILGGDLNLGPKVHEDRPSRDYFPEIWDEAFPRLFADFTRFEPIDSVPTWSMSTNSWSDGTSEDGHLDHILVGPGLRIARAGVVLNQPVTLRPGLQGHVSDHYGVEAVIEKAVS